MFTFLSGQKFIKSAKNGPIESVFENLWLKVKQCYQTGQKLLENAKLEMLSWDLFLVF